MRFTDYGLIDIFKFEERDVVSYMMHKLKLGSKFKESFNYIISKMPVKKLGTLSKMKWDIGKNYDWIVIEEGMVTFIIRKYQTHFTIFIKVEAEEKWNSKFGCFMFHSDCEKMNDDTSDIYVENNFIDLDELLKPLFKFIADGNIHSLWNNYSFKRPDHVSIKNIWNGGDDLSNINEFIFCCDELFSKYLELFAQTDMLEKIKTIKVGDILGGVYEVTQVSTDTNDGYFHNAGLKLKNLNFKESEIWCDVYSLTRYYLKYVFPEHS